MTLLDAELVVIDAIETLKLCDCYREEPTHTPTIPYATVMCDGGGMMAPTVSTPSVTLTFHAQTWKEVRTLALNAEKQLPKQMLKNPICYDVSIESVYRDDDTTTNIPACSLTIDMTLAG